MEFIKNYHRFRNNSLQSIDNHMKKNLRIAQINSDNENLQHRFKVEVANHKIDLAKLQRDFLQQQEQLNLRVSRSDDHIREFIQIFFICFFRIRRSIICSSVG